MIREMCMNACTGLSQELTNSNIVLEPATGSMLDQLVQCSTPDGVDGTSIYKINNTEVYFDDILNNDINPVSLGNEIIKTSKIAEIDGNSTHDILMEDFSISAAKIVQNNLKLARSVVYPIITSIVDEVESILKNVNFNPTGIALTKEYFDNIWLSPALADMVSKYDNVAYEPITLNKFMPAKIITDIKDLASTGSKSFDEMLNICMDKNTSQLNYIYHKMFTKEDLDDDQPMSSGNSDDLKTYVYLPKVLSGDDKNYILYIFLIAKKLFNTVPTDIKGITLGDYKNYMAGIMEQSGRILNMIITKISNILKSAELVIYAGNNYDPVISVNGTVFDEWITKGGSVEIILGAYVCGDLNTYSLNYTANRLMENSEKYISKWNQYYNLEKNKIVSNNFNSTVTTIRDVMSKRIASADSNLNLDKGLLQNQLSNLISKLSAYQLDKSIYTVIKDLVCDLIYPGNEVKTLLTMIDNYTKTDQKLTMQDAAHWASMDLIVEWIGRLIISKKTK